jgi:hypothetical protein
MFIARSNNLPSQPVRLRHCVVMLIASSGDQDFSVLSQF